MEGITDGRELRRYFRDQSGHVVPNEITYEDLMAAIPDNAVWRDTAIELVNEVMK